MLVCEFSKNLVLLVLVLKAALFNSHSLNVMHYIKEQRTNDDYTAQLNVERTVKCNV